MSMLGLTSETTSLLAAPCSPHFTEYLQPLPGPDANVIDWARFPLPGRDPYAAQQLHDPVNSDAASFWTKDRAALYTSRLFEEDCIGRDLENAVGELASDIKKGFIPAGQCASTRTLEQAMDVCDRVARSYQGDAEAVKTGFRLLTTLVRDINPVLFGAVIPALTLFHPSNGAQSSVYWEMLSELLDVCPGWSPYGKLDPAIQEAMETVLDQDDIQRVLDGPVCCAPESVREKVRARYPPPFDRIFPHDRAIAKELMYTRPEIFHNVDAVRTLLRYGIRLHLTDYIRYVLDRDMQDSATDAVLQDVLPLLDSRTYFQEIVQLLNGEIQKEPVGVRLHFQSLTRRLPFLLANSHLIRMDSRQQAPDDIIRCIATMMTMPKMHNVVCELFRLHAEVTHGFGLAAALMVVGRSVPHDSLDWQYRMPYLHVSQNSPPSSIALVDQVYCKFAVSSSMRQLLSIPEGSELGTLLQFSIMIKTPLLRSLDYYWYRYVIRKSTLFTFMRGLAHYNDGRFLQHIATEKFFMLDFIDDLLLNHFSQSDTVRRCLENLLPNRSGSLWILRPLPNAISKAETIASDRALTLQLLCNPAMYNDLPRTCTTAFGDFFGYVSKSHGLFDSEEFMSFVDHNRSLVFDYLRFLIESGKADVMRRLIKYPFMRTIVKHKDRNGKCLSAIAFDLHQYRVGFLLKIKSLESRTIFDQKQKLD